MELSSVFGFSPRINPIIIPRNNLRVSFDHDTKNIPIKSFYFPPKCSINNFQPTVLLGLYGPNRCLKSLSIDHQRQNSIRACAQVGSPAESYPPVLTKFSKFGSTCWRFVRPHTIKGTIVGSIALFARELLENPNLFSWSLMFRAFTGLLVFICANGCIVGINQIYDIDIDRVNKPDLPIPAGDLSVNSAWFLVIFYALAGLLVVHLNSGPLLISLYCFGIVYGALYSVPPIRMKRSPVAAFLLIVTLRGFLLNFCVYYATRATLGLAFEWRTPYIFITIFFILFALVISITKDLSDVEGDRRYKIPTFATKLGVKNMAFLGSGLLILNYVAAIVVAIMLPQTFNRNFMLLSHATLALSLIFQTWVLDQANYAKEACQRFYQFIWILHYSEYIIFPFI